MITCQTLRSKVCCTSCHDDADDGCGELIELYDDGKLVGMVCCLTYDYMRKQIAEAKKKMAYNPMDERF